MHNTTFASRARNTVGATAVALFAFGVAGPFTDPAAAATKTTKAGAAKQPESLEDFLGMNADSDANRRKAEEQIATCMRKEGFTYIPNTSGRVGVSIRIGGNAPAGEDPREWKRKHGYGIAESMGSIARADPNKDPNQAIIAKLSESERRAYQKALLGRVPEVKAGEAMVVTATSAGQPQGCMGKAYEGTRAVFDAFASKLEEARRRFEADPRVVKANAAWSACMRKSGYDVKNADEVISKLIMPAQQKLFGLPSPSGSASGPVRVQMVAPTPEKIEAFRKIELAIAKADADCSPAVDVSAAVRAEYEKAFIEENRGALEKARAAS